MKKKVMAMMPLLIVGTVVYGGIVDQWDMNDNGTVQTSNNGTDLTAHFNSANQQVSQVDDDGVFFFSPTATQNYSGKVGFSSSVSLTAGVVRLSWTVTDMDLSSTPTANAAVGFRLWNSNETEWVGLQISDISDKIWVKTTTSANLGGIAENSGRLVNGLSETGGSHTFYLEIDYAGSEIRTYADLWNYSPVNGLNSTAVMTNTVDFAGAGITDLSEFQTYYTSWSAGDVITMDNLQVEMISELPTEMGDISIEVIGTNAVISWQGSDLLTYTLQGRGLLTGGSWSNLVSGIEGDAGFMSVTNSVSDSDVMFYQVVAD